MVTVKLSETYDLSTQINKLGIIGVHTPSSYEIKRVWGAMYNSHSHYRLVGCDVSIACASMMPADPLQIGVEDGTIAPQDMFNPILYTACSNEGFNRIINRIYSADQVPSQAGNEHLGSLVREDLDSSKTGNVTPFDIYYGLLAETDRWRKAMPQSGLRINGLYPIVYSVLNTYGNGYSSGAGENVGMIGSTNPTEQSRVPKGDTGYSSAGYFMKGPSMRLPPIPTISIAASSTSGAQVQYPAGYPPCYVCCLIMPPGKLNKFYYRMRVTWHIQFFGIRSDLETASLQSIGSTGLALYGTDYAEQSKTMSKTDETVDVKDADLDHIMTST